ncbi:MAG: GNAT family N-acetyltransferase [bacterium]|nr:GNAT family N-acetyltransferase [bacterium]
MNVNIRLMIDDDLDQVTDLWDQHVAEVGGAAFDEAARMRIFGGLCRCLPAVTSVCYVAETDGKIVGFIVAALSESALWQGQAGDIEELFVLPAYRRRRVATGLVNTVSGWLRAKGAGVLRVNADVSAADVQAFWSAMGWENDLSLFSRYD